jgi:hypothetical protein
MSHVLKFYDKPVTDMYISGNPVIYEYTKDELKIICKHLKSYDIVHNVNKLHNRGRFDLIFYSDNHKPNYNIPRIEFKNIQDKIFSCRELTKQDENICKVIIFDHVKYSYAQILYQSEINESFKLSLIIEDDDISEIIKNLGTIGVYSMILDRGGYPDRLVITEQINITTYWELSTILNKLPELNCKYLEYFLQYDTSNLEKYLKYKLEEYPEFLELIYDDETYHDLVLKFGFDYFRVYVENVQPNTILHFVDIAMGNYNKLDESQFKFIFHTLLDVKDSPEIQIRRKIMFKHLTGISLNSSIPFDINFDIDTIINLGKFYASSKDK